MSRPCIPFLTVRDPDATKTVTEGTFSESKLINIPFCIFFNLGDPRPLVHLVSL